MIKYSGANKFSDIYKERIENYARQIKRQFAQITSLYPTDTAIYIIEEGTRMEAKFEDGLIKYSLYIGFNEIKELHEHSDLDLFDCFCKIISHEYLHILCGHFNKRKLNDIHSFALGKSIHLDKVDHIRGFSAFKIPYDANVAEANKNIDGIMLNIAGDFEINHMLNINHPGIRAKDFGLPDGLNTLEYYSIIFHILNSFPNGMIQSKHFTSLGKKTHISEYFAYAKMDIYKLYESIQMQKIIGDIVTGVGNPIPGYAIDYWAANDKLSNMKRNNLYGNLQGNIQSYARKMNIAKTGIWKEFNDILNSLKYDKRTKLSFMDKSTDWTKFNNRKDETNLLYPGKRDIRGALERKITQMNVLFVDISSSIDDVIEPLFTFCYYALKSLDLTLVFYDTQIQLVYTNASKINLEPFTCGGTNAYAAVKEYEKKWKRPTNVYIITDGGDATLDAVQTEYNGKVWILNKNSINERRIP